VIPAEKEDFGLPKMDVVKKSPINEHFFIFFANFSQNCNNMLSESVCIFGNLAHQTGKKP